MERSVRKRGFEKRSGGVLLHLSSLPGNYSCGSLGREAKAFIDLLQEGGFTAWQMLPLCIPDEMNSPYKSVASFSLNPFFIDLEDLAQRELLTPFELRAADGRTPYSCEFDRLRKERLPLLAKAAARVPETEKNAIRARIEGDVNLCAACRYLALLDDTKAKGQVLTMAQFRDKTLTPSPERLFLWQFIHATFLRQWQELHDYAAAKGVRLIGDLPIYVAEDSADLFAAPQLFQLDAAGRPEAVAGVPPDYFSPDGQLWGNPLYRWEEMEKDGFAWWRDRLTFSLSLFDGLRIDHFRGLASYYSIPAGAESAKEGVFREGPGKKLLPVFDAVTSEKNFLIAEDLGTLTPDVTELLEESGLPGMRVLQFGFNGEGGACPHLPHNYDGNCVAYTGTHDNNTLLGYLFDCEPAVREEICRYFGHEGDWNTCYDTVLRSMLASHAGLVIFPIQDLLKYGKDTRMNVPGRADGNWSYRVTEEQLRSIDWKTLREWNRLYGRI